jgi:MFS family permease
LIQLGASKSLEGIHSLAGWRWMYIICTIITILVGVLGFFVLPETPEKPNKWILKDSNVKIAKEHLQHTDHKTEGKVYNADFVQLANLRCVIISSIGHSLLEWIHEYHYR